MGYKRLMLIGVILCLVLILFGGIDTYTEGKEKRGKIEVRLGLLILVVCKIISYMAVYF